MLLTYDFKKNNMNKLILPFLFALSLVSCTPKSNFLIERELLQMLDEKDYFRIEIFLEEKRSELSKDIVLYVEAHLQNAFNRTEQSLQTIDALLSHYDKSLNDTLLLNVYQLKYDNLLKRSIYREAVEALEIAMNRYGYVLDSVALANMREAYNTVEPLKELPPQKIYLTDDVTIPVSRNQFSHVIMRVSGNGQSEDFVFDTGAMFSTISESCAVRLGIRILQSAVNVGTSINSKVQSKIGVADKLQIGELLLENVAFLVLPDEMLTFPQVNYAIHGIIGFPIMYMMKEISIQQDEILTVSVRPKKRDLRNLFLDGLSPIVQFEVEGDTVLFKMDTGANTSDFSEKYFSTHKDIILAKGTPRIAKRGGGGGIIEQEVYDLENVRLKIGGQEFTIPTITVLPDKFSFFENYDGNLGQDVLMYFNKFILNFEDMYLAFEN